MTDVERISYARDVPVAAETDVPVVGGGPAGIAAAVASGRTGARTVLVERFGFLGGNAMAGLVGPFMTSYSQDAKIQLIKGVFEELVERAEALGAIRVIPPPFAMGQAAGTAAALAVAESVEPRDVPVPWLQDTLVKGGAYLGDAVNRRVQRGEGARR